MSDNRLKSAPIGEFGETKTGLIGLKRDTMLQSELQYLPQLGKVKNRGHRLPHKEFSYGVTYEKLDGGVPEALQHWINKAKDAKAKQERYQMVRDFLALNKAALKSGAVNAKQNSHYRSLNDIQKRVKIGGGGRLDDPSSLDGAFNRKKTNFPPGMTFGLPNRPSTPVSEVLEHRYLREWIEAMERTEAEHEAVKKEASKAISGAYHTKASWLKNAKIPVEEKPLWKMPRFRCIDPAVDSFRTEEARQKAMSAHACDKIPREGVNAFNTGVYTVKRNDLPS